MKAATTPAASRPPAPNWIRILEPSAAATVDDGPRVTWAGAAGLSLGILGAPCHHQLDWHLQEGRGNGRRGSHPPLEFLAQPDVIQPGGHGDPANAEATGKANGGLPYLGGHRRPWPNLGSPPFLDLHPQEVHLLRQRAVFLFPMGFLQEPMSLPAITGQFTHANRRDTCNRPAMFPVDPGERGS